MLDLPLAHMYVRSVYRAMLAVRRTAVETGCGILLLFGGLEVGPVTRGDGGNSRLTEARDSLALYIQLFHCGFCVEELDNGS